MITIFSVLHPLTAGGAVAMTRPKRHLCVVGDGETVGKGSGFLARWVGHLEAEADLRYPDLADLQAL